VSTSFARDARSTPLSPSSSSSPSAPFAVAGLWPVLEAWGSASRRAEQTGELKRLHAEKVREASDLRAVICQRDDTIAQLRERLDMQQRRLAERAKELVALSNGIARDLASL